MPILLPGIFISVLTFQGVIVHELAHQICCKICHIVGYDVKYYQFHNKAGYVIHEATDDPKKNMIIGMRPFFVNTILGMLITLPAYINVFGFNSQPDEYSITKVMSYILFWLGISVLMHSFPSTEDAKALIESVLKNKEVGMGAKIISAPFIGLIYVGAWGSIIWLDLVYGIAMSMVLPRLIGFLLFL